MTTAVQMATTASPEEPTVTPEEVKNYSKPTENFLCSPSANIYNVEFYRFTIRDMTDAGKVYFDVEHSPEQYRLGAARMGAMTPEAINEARKIYYKFPASLLRQGTIGARLVFGINGPLPVKNFRLIERYYFRDTLLKSYNFDFGFCIPHSTNTWEAIYDLPNLSEEWQKSIVDNPNETVSDSFYFVENKLILHNRAYYTYYKE